MCVHHQQVNGIATNVEDTEPHTAYGTGSDETAGNTAIGTTARGHRATNTIIDTA